MSGLGKRTAEELIRPNKRARQREQKKTAHQIDVESELRPSASTLPNAAFKVPAQLFVEKELASYAYETQSLLKAIKSSSAGSSIRAWQMLPRHKRRRNASHNLLSLPKRLRGKGKAELRASNTIALSRSEIRKRKGRKLRAMLGAYPRRKEAKRKSELIDRAADAASNGKAWLETHMWHAKRFRMSGQEAKLIDGQSIEQADRWGFNLAEESHLKSFRSSWRDEKNAVTIMDRSYDAWLRINALDRQKDFSDREGTQKALGCLLKKAGFENGWQDEWRKDQSHRACDTVLSIPLETEDKGEEFQFGQRRAVTPVQVIWVIGRLGRIGNEILIRSHPASIAQVERAIRQAIVPALQETKVRSQILLSRLNNIPHPITSAGSGAKGRRHGKKPKKKQQQQRQIMEYAEVKRPGKVLIEKIKQNLLKEWQRQQAFNVFELSGPSAEKLISKVLVPIHKHNNQAHLENSMRRSKGQNGEIISLDVHDPRLSFPPRKEDKLKKQKKQKESFRKESHQRLFHEGCPIPTYSSGEIHSRRAALPVPGTRLKPSSKDDIIPVVLIRHRLSLHQSSWTIILPRGWGKAFWLSFVHPGTRVLGQNQLHALQFDKGKPTFPCDWVSTSAFKRWSESEGTHAFNAWQRTPPAKRVNFDHHSIRWPFGGDELWLEIVRNGTITCLGKNGEHIKNTAKRPPWLFTSGINAITLSDLIDQYQFWVQSGKPVNHPFPIFPFLLELRRALLMVRLTACRKGTFERWDEIHSVSKEESMKWRSALQATQDDKNERDQLKKLEQNDSNNSTHIGSITTGQFALSFGKGKAIGSISLLAYLEIVRQNNDFKSTNEETNLSSNNINAAVRNPIPLSNLVLIRSTKGGPMRAASMEAIPLL